MQPGFRFRRSAAHSWTSRGCRPHRFRPKVARLTDRRTVRRREARGAPHGAAGDQPVDRLMTAGEVGELLGVPTSWVYEQSRLGRIPTVTLGRYRRYRRSAIEAWVERLETPDNG
jgi:excisionase family DNA binding protein